ncbi:MAG: glutathione S-transferase [Rhodobacteraceae bacterium]|jgi:glutathione S-transferase|nr:glutathione S-transferase [Paracoccaceae bacterium]
MLVLHFQPDTASTILRLVAAVAGITLSLRPVDRAGGELDSPTWRAMNPTGTIPVLETPQGPLSETAACLLWLSDRHGLGPRADQPGRTDFLKWLFYISNTPHADLMQLIYPQRYCPPGNEAGHATLIAGRFLVSLGHLDDAARRTPDLFGPGGPLLCYILVLARWAAFYPEGHAGWFQLAAFPALNALATETEALAAVQAIAADEGLGALPFTEPTGG